jgi:hypothetical protein
MGGTNGHPPSFVHPVRRRKTGEVKPGTRATAAGTALHRRRSEQSGRRERTRDRPGPGPRATRRPLV